MHCRRTYKDLQLFPITIIHSYRFACSCFGTSDLGLVASVGLQTRQAWRSTAYILKTGVGSVGRDRHYLIIEHYCSQQSVSLDPELVGVRSECYSLVGIYLCYDIIYLVVLGEVNTERSCADWWRTENNILISSFFYGLPINMLI